MSDGGQPASKEKPVFTDDSLQNIAKGMAKKGTQVALYLCIPHLRVILLGAQADRQPNSAEWLKNYYYLLEWKKMKAGMKEKDLAGDLERALRECGCHDLSELFIEKYRAHQPIWEDDLKVLVKPEHP